MVLNNRDLEELNIVLLRAYPSQEELERMLFFRLNLDSNTIEGKNLEAFIFNLVKKAVSDGFIERLVVEAYSFKPGNELLQQFFQKHSLGSRASVSVQEVFLEENASGLNQTSTSVINRNGAEFFQSNHIFQLKSLYGSLAQQITREQGISNIELVTDDNKLKIYKAMLIYMFNTLGEDLLELPEDHLEKIKVGMREIITGFFYLKTRPMDSKIEGAQIMPKLMEANAYLLSAIEKKRTRGVEYYLALQICRMRLFEALDYLPKS